LRDGYIHEGGTPESWEPLVRACLAPSATSAPLAWDQVDAMRFAVLYEADRFYVVSTAVLDNAVEAFRQSALTGHWISRFGASAKFRSPGLSKAGNRLATFLSFIA